MKNKSELVNCIRKELIVRKGYLETNQIETIYFGGGTPSLLEKEELQNILETIHKEFEVAQDAEITLEANPDDLTIEKLKELKSCGVNRLSIGIQSFIGRDLLFMNRSHTIKQAVESVANAKELGFDNMTIDLIYGIPNLTQTEWKRNIQKALELDVNHISAYCLTSEERTAMHHDIAKGKYELPKEEAFSKIGHNSKHNSSYWKQKNFLGVGPSAHSFNGKTRHWNVSNNGRYIKGANDNNWVSEEETLDEKTHYNEYIMTSLRTSWGINLKYLKENFDPLFVSHFIKESKRFVIANSLIQKGTHFTLSQEGKLLADGIASDLFVVE
jgi:oxygen-independent coproporphyrinogen-3 oxidase